MAVRTTNVQATNNLIDQIFLQRRELDNIRNQVSSGIRVAEASDDAGRAGTISQFQGTLSRIDRHQQRISTAASTLEIQGSVLDSVTNLLLRSKELAAGAANGTVPSDVRAALSEEIFELRDQLVGLINSRSQGSYVYGGADDDDPPYDALAYTNGEGSGLVRYVYDGDIEELGGALEYDGEREALYTTRLISITDSDLTRVNTDGGVFRRAVAAMEQLGRALQGFRTDTSTVTDPNGVDFEVPDGGGTAYNFPNDYQEQTTAITDAIDALDLAQTEDIDPERTSVGSRLNRLFQARDILALIEVDTQEAKAAIQDADIFEAASRLSSAEVSLQALLQSGAQINQLTLLNFI